MAIASISIFRGFSITLCLSRKLFKVSKMSNLGTLNYCLCAETQYAKFCVHPFKVVSLGVPLQPSGFSCMQALLVFKIRCSSGHIFPEQDPQAGELTWGSDPCLLWGDLYTLWLTFLLWIAQLGEYHSWLHDISNSPTTLIDVFISWVVGNHLC